MDSDSDSAPMDLDLDAPDYKDLGMDGDPAITTPPNASDLDAVTTSDIKPDDHRREQGQCNQLNGQG